MSSHTDVSAVAPDCPERPYFIAFALERNLPRDPA
jgi:hypothetical protein